MKFSVAFAIFICLVSCVFLIATEARRGRGRGRGRGGKCSDAKNSTACATRPNKCIWDGTKCDDKPNVCEVYTEEQACEAVAGCFFTSEGECKKKRKKNKLDDHDDDNDGCESISTQETCGNIIDCVWRENRCKRVKPAGGKGGDDEDDICETYDNQNQCTSNGCVWKIDDDEENGGECNAKKKPKKGGNGGSGGGSNDKCEKYDMRQECTSNGCVWKVDDDEENGGECKKKKGKG